MIKLTCEKCKKDWYTANTHGSIICDACGGNLIEVDEKQSVNIKVCYKK